MVGRVDGAEDEAEELILFLSMADMIVRGYEQQRRCRAEIEQCKRYGMVVV